MPDLKRFVFVFAVLVATNLVSNGASANAFGSGYSPRVPVSKLSIPSWFDPSRLSVSTSVTVGGGYGGTGGLSVTSFSYRFGTPLAVSVNLGNAFGGGATRSSSSSGFFLEGLDLAYRPRQSVEFQIHYHDIRSPLQYGSRNSSSFWSP